MFVKINAATNIGLDSSLVEVEADFSPSEQPKFIIVGLTDVAIQEARERVRLAVINSGFSFPRPKVIVSLAPADLKKEGPSYDLAIALAVIIANQELRGDFSDSIFIGELALNGETRSTTGILPIALFAKEHGYKNLFVPAANTEEASLIPDLKIFPVKNLRELISHLRQEKLITPVISSQLNFFEEQLPTDVDMKFVAGQEQAKRALEIAAAGFHNVLMSGPPGSGKTLLARTLPTILPPMSEAEVLEVTKIYSIAGLLSKEKPLINTRPFRSPHHTSSGVALVGGGKLPKPGEISLAHRGILFLDEFPEFPRVVLENLRQPLEDGKIAISRAQGTLIFPARFTLVASQNPCPCGYYNDPEKKCTCTAIQISKYQKKISGPIIDRIDLHITVPRINFEKLTANNETTESSAQIRERVILAQQAQQKRFAGMNIRYNSEMRPQDLKQFCIIDQTSSHLLEKAVAQLHLSARSFHRILKIARTIADLNGKDTIELNHLAEALQYRPQ
jgi:magnesium chelatase family protein